MNEMTNQNMFYVGGDLILECVCVIIEKKEN